MLLGAVRPAGWGLCFAALLGVASGACADEPFYKGKRLTLLVNFAVGGPTDIEGRLFAKYIVKHIEGQPSIIVQDMDGAGGIVGAKYLGEVAPRDGTMIGYITGTGFMYALDPDRFRVDFRTYEFLAYQPGTTIHYMRTDVPPGIKQAADIAKAKGLIAGGLSADTPKDLRLRLGLDMLGVPYKYVTGYRSSPPARLALERGEINLFSESPPSYRSVIEPGMVAKGEAIPVFYDPGYDGQSFSVPKQVEGLAILPFQELFRKIKGTMPSGKLWDVYRTILSADGAMQRQIVLPPAAPPAAVAALRAAIGALNADQDYAQEASQSFGYAPQWEVGSDINDKVRRALSTDPEIRTFLADYMKNPPK
jgi:tripartite-type tricarboxylate transporter receptor subunit TctC